MVENPMVQGLDAELIRLDRECAERRNKMKKFVVEGHCTYNFSIEVNARNEEEAMDYILENYSVADIVDTNDMEIVPEYAELKED